MSYSFALEDGEANYPELEKLYRAHYAEMRERLSKDGVDIPDYNPRLSLYFNANKQGYLLNIVARTDEGEAVGYCNVYITNDMHNGDLIAREDTLYVTPEHRNGVGRRMVQWGLQELKGRGCKRLLVQPATDLRVGAIWQRMGFKPVAMVMAYTF